MRADERQTISFTCSDCQQDLLIRCERCQHEPPCSGGLDFVMNGEHDCPSRQGGGMTDHSSCSEERSQMLEAFGGEYVLRHQCSEPCPHGFLTVGYSPQLGDPPDWAAMSGLSADAAEHVRCEDDHPERMAGASHSSSVTGED